MVFRIAYGVVKTVFDAIHNLDKTQRNRHNKRGFAEGWKNEERT